MSKNKTKAWEGMTQEKFLKQIAPDVIEYVNWYAEHGISLPEEFNNNPAKWTQILLCIAIPFIMAIEDRGSSSDEEEKLGFQGLDYFYQYSQWLWK